MKKVFKKVKRIFSRRRKNEEETLKNVNNIFQSLMELAAEKASRNAIEKITSSIEGIPPINKENKKTGKEYPDFLSMGDPMYPH